MSFYLPKPDTHEVKPPFDALPPELKSEIEKTIGRNIERAHIIYGGYSSAFSVIAVAKDGSEYFIKGSHPGEMSHGAKTLEQEIHIYKAVSILADIAPAFIGQTEWGGEDDWRLGIWQAVAGSGIKPVWDEADFAAFGETLCTLYTSFDLKTADVKNATDTNFIKDIVSGKNSWRKFNAFAPRKDEFADMFENPDAGRAWLEDHLDKFISGSQRPVQHFETLVHFDLRHDNILFDDQNQALIIDWPNGCIGPAGYDLVCVACDLMVHGNGPAWDIFEKLCAAAKLQIDSDDVIHILMKISGYYALNAYREVPEKLPRLRWLQQAFLYAMTEWLNHLKQCDSMPKIAN